MTVKETVQETILENINTTVAQNGGSFSTVHVALQDELAEACNSDTKVLIEKHARLQRNVITLRYIASVENQSISGGTQNNSDKEHQISCTKISVLMLASC